MWNINSLVPIDNEYFSTNNHKGCVETFPINDSSSYASHNMFLHSAMYQASSQSKEVRTLLCYAAASGHIDVVNVLLEFGALVDTTDCCQLTPLMTCCELVLESGDLTSWEQLHSTKASIISLLASKGANMNHRTHCCCMTPLMYAAAKAPFLLDLLIKEGANCHLTDDFGFTFIHHAIAVGRLVDLSSHHFHLWQILCLKIHLQFHGLLKYQSLMIPQH